MIVWLASYPRSGNTLLRTLLYQAFGLHGYADEQGPEEHVESPEAISARSIVGGRRHPGTWEEFYEMASGSDELFLVKTHRAPIDAQPAIHVVRDGRKASHSYFHFLKNYFQDSGRSLLEVLVGDDAYGHWSSHYDSWHASRGPRLQLRFEDLLAPEAETLDSIGTFIGRVADGREWQNPIEELNRIAPQFFREGKAEWTAPGDWRAVHDSVFRSLHAPLMQTLGYEVSLEVDPAIQELANLAADLASKITR